MSLTGLGIRVNFLSARDLVFLPVTADIGLTWALSVETTFTP